MGGMTELKDKLLSLTIEYTKKHLNSSNLEQNNAKHDINLIAKVLEIINIK